MPQTPLKNELEQLSERELIACCQQGNLDAFDFLIKRYEQRVLNLTLRYLRDYHLALEEAQEVFLKVFSKISHFRGDSAFSTWLYRVTSNHCYNVLEREKKKRQMESGGSLDVAITEDPKLLEDHKTEDPHELLSQREVQQAMADALAALPNDQRQVILLCHFEQLNYAQIADVMQLPVSTVSSCLYRARRQLKKIIVQRKGGGQKWMKN